MFGLYVYTKFPRSLSFVGSIFMDDTLLFYGFARHGIDLGPIYVSFQPR